MSRNSSRSRDGRRSFVEGAEPCGIELAPAREGARLGEEGPARAHEHRDSFAERHAHRRQAPAQVRGQLQRILRGPVAGGGCRRVEMG